jgi:hypothetical protein
LALRNGNNANMIEEERKNYQEMIDYMLAKDKIFMIKKPESVNNQTR